MPNTRESKKNISYYESSESDYEEINESSDDYNDESDNESCDESNIDDLNKEVSDEIGIGDLDESDLNESMQIDDEFFGKDGFSWKVQPPLRLNISKQTNYDRIESGFLTPVHGMTTMLEFFCYILDDSMLTNICIFTNKKLEQTEKEISLNELRYVLNFDHRNIIVY